MVPQRSPSVIKNIELALTPSMPSLMPMYLRSKPLAPNAIPPNNAKTIAAKGPSVITGNEVTKVPGAESSVPVAGATSPEPDLLREIMTVPARTMITPRYSQNLTCSLRISTLPIRTTMEPTVKRAVKIP